MPCGQPLLGPAKAGGNLCREVTALRALLHPLTVCQFPRTEALAQREKPNTRTAGYKIDTSTIAGSGQGNLAADRKILLSRATALRRTLPEISAAFRVELFHIRPSSVGPPFSRKTPRIDASLAGPVPPATPDLLEAPAIQRPAPFRRVG